MKTLRLLLLGTAALVFSASIHAQPAPGAKPAAGTPPAGATAKAKPYSPADTKAYIEIAEAIQFHLKIAERMRGKYKDGPPEMTAFAGKISKESIALFTPGVDAAMAHGVEGKKIPQDMSKNDKAALAKLGAIKDEKKWELAFFEHYAKESKKSAADAEKATKTVQDPDLKTFAEKAVAQLKTEAEEAEAKFKEVKAKK